MRRIFLDIGANVGTTCVFVSKQYPNLHLIAFEPDEENNKVLSINCSLNKLYDRISIVNKGLSNNISSGKMRQFGDNRGRNYIIYDDSPKQEDQSLEIVDITTLDSYLSENSIEFSSVDFIWMDTEGFEPYVIDGAMNLLSRKKIPIWMEFCGETLRGHEGSYELLVGNLSKVYSKVRFIDAGRERELDIKNLDELLERNDSFNLFLY